MPKKKKMKVDRQETSSAPVIAFDHFKGISEECKDLVTLEATVVTGFEDAAKQEATEALKAENVVKYQGRIIFDTPIDNVEKVNEKTCRWCQSQWKELELLNRRCNSGPSTTFWS